MFIAFGFSDRVIFCCFLFIYLQERVLHVKVLVFVETETKYDRPTKSQSHNCWDFGQKAEKKPTSSFSLPDST